MFNQLENFGYSRCTYNRYSCVQLSESYPAYACTVKKKNVVVEVIGDLKIMRIELRSYEW